MLKYLHRFISLNKLALKTCLVIFLLLIGSQENVYSQNCTANAGGNVTVITLTGSVAGTLGAGNPTWTFTSGATTQTIVNPNALVTNITGKNYSVISTN